MSIVDGMQTLERLVGRFEQGGAVAEELAPALLTQLAELERDAREGECAELAGLCSSLQLTLKDLSGSPRFASQVTPVSSYLRELIRYALELAASLEAAPQAGATPVAPAALALVDVEEERLFRENVGLFVSNALGGLADLEEDLLSIAGSSEDRYDDAVAAIRRTVHTLKAEFGVLDHRSAQELCHTAETAIDHVIERGLDFPVDLLLQVGDAVKQFVEGLAADVHTQFDNAEPLLKQLNALLSEGPAGDGTQSADGAVPDSVGDALVDLTVGGEFVDSLPDFVSEARSHLSDSEVAMVELSTDPGNVENLNLTFRAFHTIKGVAGFLNLSAIVELAHAAETLLDGGRSLRFEFESEDIDLVLAAVDLIGQMLNAFEGSPAPKVQQWRQLMESLQERAAREVDAASDAAASQEPANDEPAKEAAEEAPAGVGAEAQKGTPSTDGSVLQPAAPPPPTSKPTPPKATAPAGKKQTTAAKVERTIKVSTTRLDLLVDMVGELVIAQSMVLQDPAVRQAGDQNLARNISQVGKITRDLQEAAMSLRMVTVKATFQKMARLVRDVASKSGKKVALSISGEDTELDRNVVEQISDPLVHMIRNAVDHGIEAPPDRLKVDKEEQGSLSLLAYHQGGSIVIEIRDDGRGIDRDKVFEKALQKGLIAPDTNPASLSDGEVYGMIFLPGFSTAEQVTDLSGRGVGMDVVRRNIEALRGKIEIESTLGAGTTFRLRLPLTLAIIDGMVVSVGESRYVIPTLSIEQSFRPASGDVHYVVDRGECIHVRGAVLPLYRLKQIFDQSEGLDELEDGILIVVEVDGQRSCLFVDEIVGQQQVVIKSLGMSRERCVGLSGGAIMTDGRVALIVDVATLVDSVLT
ncbi:MAG: chemotaxis protein CheA [Planctomycetota bacterium]